jgi:hypothetical protein
MYYFFMDKKVAETEAVKRDLAVSGTKGSVRVYSQVGQAKRVHYDFLQVMDALRHAFDPHKYRAATIVTSDFENGEFFTLKYSTAILFWIKADTPDFLNDSEAALIYKINKYWSSDSQRKKLDVAELMQALKNSLARFRSPSQQ